MERNEKRKGEKNELRFVRDWREELRGEKKRKRK